MRVASAGAFVATSREQASCSAIQPPQIDAVRVAHDEALKLEEKFGDVPKTDKKKYRKARWKIGRAKVATSQSIRSIEFTEAIKRKLIDDLKSAVDEIQWKQKDIRQIDQKLDPPKGTKGKKLREEEKKLLMKHKADIRKEIAQKFPEYLKLIDPKPATVEQIQAAMQDGEALFAHTVEAQRESMATATRLTTIVPSVASFATSTPTATRLARAKRSPSRAVAVMDFPQPDSPTIATVSP